MIGLCCSAVAIHEADEILSRGFEDQIYKVLKHFAMISSKLLRPTYIKQFVMDKTDKMMSRGLTDKIYDVLGHFDKETQIILLSTTMPDKRLEGGDLEGHYLHSCGSPQLGHPEQVQGHRRRIYRVRL